MIEKMNTSTKEDIINHILHNSAKLIDPIILKYINGVIEANPLIVLNLDDLFFDLLDASFDIFILLTEYYNLTSLLTYIFLRGDEQLRSLVYYLTSHQMMVKLAANPEMLNQLDPYKFCKTRGALKNLDYFSKAHGLIYSCKCSYDPNATSILSSAMGADNRMVNLGEIKPWILHDLVIKFNNQVYSNLDQIELSQREYVIFSEINENIVTGQGIKDKTMAYLQDRLGAKYLTSMIRKLIRENILSPKIDRSEFINLGLMLDWVYGNQGFVNEYINEFLAVRNIDPIHIELLIQLGYHQDQNQWLVFVERVVDNFLRNFKKSYTDSMIIDFLEILLLLKPMGSLDHGLKDRLKKRLNKPDIDARSFDHPEDYQMLFHRLGKLYGFLQ